jgi:hypothetical protein
VTAYPERKKMTMKTQPKPAGKAASKLISERIAELGDWRGKTLARMRALIKEVDPEVVEEWKWRGTPVWEKGGIIVVANPHKGKVKLTFFQGAQLKDPKKLFNNGLDGNTWRAVDYLEGDKVDAAGLKALVKAAIAFNEAKAKKPATAKKVKKAKPRA